MSYRSSVSHDPQRISEACKTPQSQRLQAFPAISQLLNTHSLIPLTPKQIEQILAATDPGDHKNLPCLPSDLHKPLLFRWLRLPRASGGHRPEKSECRSPGLVKDAENQTLCSTQCEAQVTISSIFRASDRTDRFVAPELPRSQKSVFSKIASVCSGVGKSQSQATG